MFTHADRIPTTVPNGNARATRVPWALQGMRPYPNQGSADYASVSLDPETQTAVFHDFTGRVMEMPKHGTSTGTRESTRTSQGDGQNPGTDADSTSDNDQ